MTVGEMMAMRLKGEDVSMDDINKATVTFFEDRGVSCTITSEKAEEEEGD